MKTLLAISFAALALGAGAAPALASDRVFTLRGVDAPGPARYDKVTVLAQGSPAARHVLVLEPGTSAGAAYFRPIAAAIVARARGWQVWSIERRENLLEDHSMLDRALAGKATVQQLFDYYLGWIGNSKASGTKHFVPKTDAATGFGRRWGMGVAVGDLHRVIAAARRGGRTVVLGGHSLGGTIVTAYATWDFHGRPGARDLAGLVFIDGAGGGFGRPVPTAAQARASLKQLAGGSPWLDLTGLGLPWAAGLFNAVGSTAVLEAPEQRSPFQDWPLLPADLRTPVPVTNRAAYGYSVDTQTGPKSLALVQMHIGHLAASGDPRDWVDGELGTVERAARVFAGIHGMDGSAWYHPRRLSLDGSAVNNGIPTAAQRVLGDRTVRGRSVRLPMYAIETSLGAGHVLRSVRALARQSHVPARWLTLVDRHRTYAHIDPLAALPAKNAFLKTVVPFLRRIR